MFRYYPYVAGDYLPAGLRLLHITDDPSEAARAPVGDSLLGDAVLSLDALIAQVKPRPVGSAAVKRKAHGLAPHPAATHAESTDGLLSSLSVFQALRAATPANTVLIEESRP